jgi:hypothetical protein
MTSSSSYPNLREYLSREAQTNVPTPADLGWSIGALLGWIGLSIGVVFVGRAAERLTVAAAVLFLVFGTIAVAGGAALWVYSRVVKRRAIGPDVVAQARPVSQKLHGSLMSRRIHRELHPAVVELLEGSAAQWKRVRTTFDSPFWNRRDLPDDMGKLKQRGLLAADVAMAEIVLTLHPTYRPAGNPDWRDALEGVLDQLGISASARRADALPPEFFEADNLAGQLRDLADEVGRISKDQSITMPRAEESLRDVLKDLREYQTAQSELDNELRG